METPKLTNLRSLVKRFAPTWLENNLIKGIQAKNSLALRIYDIKTFESSRFKKISLATQDQLEGKMTFHSHSIEKGLSHHSFRPKFGEKALAQLSAALHEYQRQDYPRTTPAYQNALSTIKAYIDRHARIGVNTEYLSKIVGDDIVEEALLCNSNLGGVLSISKSIKQPTSFAEFFNARYSVREFANKMVSEERVLPAIELALKSPSVCNRQSSRVLIVTSPDRIEKALKLQGGFTGYKTPPMLLIVTSDLSSFLNTTERNQPFIDGGLFSMSLLLALEAEQLAACPLNAMMTVQSEEAILQMFNISRSERLIMFIAVGEFLPEVQVPKSFRYPVSEVARMDP